jgi:hypothetical protein
LPEGNKRGTSIYCYVAIFLFLLIGTEGWEKFKGHHPPQSGPPSSMSQSDVEEGLCDGRWLLFRSLEGGKSLILFRKAVVTTDVAAAFLFCQSAALRWKISEVTGNGRFKGRENSIAP